MEGKITLLNYVKTSNSIHEVYPYKWEILSEPYCQAPYKGQMSEMRVLELTGLWVTNNITGETYEYLDKFPMGISRPVDLKEGLK